MSVSLPTLISMAFKARGLTQSRYRMYPLKGYRQGGTSDNCNFGLHCKKQSIDSPKVESMHVHLSY